MSENRGWAVVSLADAGDATTVLETALEENPEHLRGQVEESKVVFYNDEVHVTVVESVLNDLSDHIDRVLIVESLEGGEGQTRSRYYEATDDGLGKPVERLSSAYRWCVESHFDYYATRYGIDGAI